MSTSPDSPAQPIPFSLPATAAGVHHGGLVDAKVPDGDPATAWQRAKDSYKLVAPNNRRRFRIVVVGTGLAGAGAAASLAELGFNVTSFTYHDAPRRAHSVAAQGGINAARGRRVDGDSLRRFVTDTVKGGDFRGREHDAFRLGEESVRVIDHFSALGAPFAREYGGALATRSFGGVQVSRTYYTRGQTGQQLQIAGAQALQRQVAAGRVRLHTRHEMLDLVVDEGRCRGVVVRDLVTGQIWAEPAHAVILATGGYGNVFHDSTLAVNSNASAVWRAHQRGALFASPSFVQFHPTALPKDSDWQAKTILMSESLRNDGRIWVPADPQDQREPGAIPEADRDYFLERRYPAFGNLVPRDVASRAITHEIRSGRGVGPRRNSVYLDFADAIARDGQAAIRERYSNLFEMYSHATGEDPYTVPMRIAPTCHFTMGGLWSDYNLSTSLPGLFVGGECGWSYHGANRLGANSLLSASVDGWFVLPHVVPNYLAGQLGEDLLTPTSRSVVEAVARASARVEALLAVEGSRGPAHFHRALGEILYKGCGVTRTAEGLSTAVEEIRRLRAEFWRDVRITGDAESLNQVLEYAGRVADYLELAELMCIDALDRDESCGAHFRAEHQTPDGEAQRDDDTWCFASAWASTGDERGGKREFTRFAEPLQFTSVQLAQRNYQ